MKRGRRILVIVVACGLARVIGALVWPREREPEYQGKKLSEWIGIYRVAQNTTWADPKENLRRHEEPQRAIRAIGTNGLPFLLEWIQCEPPRWKKTLYGRYVNLPERFRNRWVGAWLLGRKEAERAVAGVLGLEVLGEGASAAIPELRRLVVGGSGLGNWHGAVQALVGMGDEGREVVFGAARNPEIRKRDFPWLLFFLSSNEFNDDGNWHTMVSIMIDGLQDKDRRYRAVAGQALGQALRRAGPNADDAIAALIKGMDDPEASVRVSCVWALVSLGGRARGALPKLKQATGDMDLSVRMGATNAVREIEREVLEGTERRQVQEGVGKSETNPSP